jgi:glycogen debranching enzyme
MTYPSSCVPQAWSAGAPFAALWAGFGLDADGSVSVGNYPEWLTDGALEPVLERWDSAGR